MKSREYAEKAFANMESPPLPVSASPTAHLPPAESPARPLLTTDSTSSYFADSGLGTTGLRTPSPKRKINPKTPQQTTLASPSKTINSISSRLEQLAALAWEAEADDRLDERTRAAVHSQLHAIEAQLEGRTRGNEQTSSDVDLSNSASAAASSASSIISPTLSHGTPAKEPEPAAASAPDLNPILFHIAATVASMRTRLSESKHLHSLALSKLSSIAQDNVDLTSQLTGARKTNTSLSHANAALRIRLDDLEATTTQQAVAVSAMTGAVAGLESYVRSSSPAPSTPRTQQLQPNGHTPNSSVRRQTVIRGSGRFRGKYPVSHPQRRDSSDMNPNLDGAYDLPPQSELQEGILAWVRGFRDVEASWREMDTHHHHRTPTRFGVGNGNATEIRDSSQTLHTPTRRGQGQGRERGQQGEVEAEERARSQSRSEEEEESVLFQGDKDGGSGADIFAEQEDEFGEFQTVTSNGPR